MMDIPLHMQDILLHTKPTRQNMMDIPLRMQDILLHINQQDNI
jgi:hypothetical protein